MKEKVCNKNLRQFIHKRSNFKRKNAFRNLVEPDVQCSTCYSIYVYSKFESEGNNYVAHLLSVLLRCESRACNSEKRAFR